jgi:hypothetical protein
MNNPFVNLKNSTRTAVAPINLHFVAKNGEQADYLRTSRWRFAVGQAANDGLHMTGGHSEKELRLDGIDGAQ